MIKITTALFSCYQLYKNYRMYVPYNFKKPMVLSNQTSNTVLKHINTEPKIQNIRINKGLDH